MTTQADITGSPPGSPTSRGDGAVAVAQPAPARLRFNLAELSGSLGDMGTFLPLAVGVSIACGMDFGLILVFAGVLHLLSGLAFRMPMPVQPMKAIAAVAIAEGLAPGEITAAGTIMGVFMVVLALSGAVDAAVRLVPRPVVRGIQVGVGVKLALAGGQWLFGLPLAGYDSLLIAALLAAAVALWGRSRTPVLLIAFLVGVVMLFVGRPDLLGVLRFQPPSPHLALPMSWDAWWTGLLVGAVPQLPLTLLNSVVAVCALSEDLFPGRGAPPRRVAVSVGMMNLLTVPLGGLPMCHGAGGLSGQHHFGARTGGSVVMLGIAKIVLGLICGAALLPMLEAYPRSILAVMLIAAGLTLARPARDSLRGWPLVILGVTTAGILFAGAAAGTAMGLAAAAILWVLGGHSR